MAYHVERVSKIIERELSTILLTEAKNNLLKYVSITKVVVTNDLSIANIWYTVIGNQNEIQATSKALEDAKGFLRSQIAKKIDLRKAPTLKFKYDESLAYGSKIEKLLEELK